MISIAGILGASLVSGLSMLLCLYDALGLEMGNVGPSIMSIIYFALLSVVAVPTTLQISSIAESGAGMILMTICAILFYWTPATIFIYTLVRNGTSP